MTTKISEITVDLTAPAGSDLVEASRDDGGGSYTTAKASLTQLGQIFAPTATQSTTIGSSVGFGAAARTVASGGTFAPNPEQGQFVQMTGSSATTVAAMIGSGTMLLSVPEAVAITLNAAYTVKGSPATGEPSMLYLAVIGTDAYAVWT